MTILLRVSWIIAILVGGFFVLLAMLLLAGFAYQWIGALLDRRRLLGHGRMVAIGEGRELYMVEYGTRGRGPTVVFESGFAATSLNWMHIQEALAGQVHTVSYDRCGLGWSSPCISDRTPSNVAKELRAMLKAAEIDPPWILAGHSFGGLAVQRFALDYPDETAALIVIDPMRPVEWPPLNAAADSRVRRAQRLARVGGACARLGMTRLAARSHFCCGRKLSGFLIRLAGREGEFLAQRLDTEIGKMSVEVRPSIAAHWSGPPFYRGLMAHLRAVPATVLEMHDVAPIAGIPVTILTPASAADVTEMGQYGPRGRHVIAERSLHWVHLDEPELVVRTIRNTVAEVVAHDHQIRPSVAAAVNQ
jgi:pimeloyl-ACP methyl ester carboxylesterase